MVLADKQLNAEVGLQLADAGGEVGRHAMHFLRRRVMLPVLATALNISS